MRSHRKVWITVSVHVSCGHGRREVARDRLDVLLEELLTVPQEDRHDPIRADSHEIFISVGINVGGEHP